MRCIFNNLLLLRYRKNFYEQSVVKKHSAHFICTFIDWWRKRSLNLKKLYYLSERIYEPIKCGEESAEARKEYWRNLLGETMFDQMYRENINFYGYVNGNEYAVRC